jgi:hypothetical protein
MDTYALRCKKRRVNAELGLKPAYLIPTMKTLVLNLGLFALLALSNQVRALSYTDVQNPNKYVPSGGSYSGVLDIVNPGTSSYSITDFGKGYNGTFTDAGGYVPGTAIESLNLRFYLTDASLIPIDVFALSLDGLTSGGILIGKRAAFSYNGSAGLIDLVEADGKLKYTVSSLLGDFTVKYSIMTATTGGNISVPDGGPTVILIGLALIGIITIQRQLSGPGVSKRVLS